MAREDAIEVEGAVVETLPRRLYRVELANGHRLLGFLAGRGKKDVAGLAAGDRVKLQLTPFNLSTGRILVRTK